MVGKYPAFKHSSTGGVQPISIEGRFYEPRARLSPEFTDADRAWRKQWLKDQVIAHDEPRLVPEHYYGTKNVVRRFYRAPFDAFEKALLPKVGAENAGLIRRIIPKTLLAYCFVVWTTYMIKYSSNDWTRVGGLRFYVGEPVCLPCHEDWPRKIEEMAPKDYDSYGFKNRQTHLKL